MSSTDADNVALIARAVLSLARRLRAERPPTGVSLSSLGLLATLHRHGPMQAKDLARRERLKPQSLTRLLAGLEAAGLIARPRDPEDGRAQRIELTQRGAAALARDLRARRAWLGQAIDAELEEPQRALLLQAAPLMLRLAEREPGPALPNGL